MRRLLAALTAGSLALSSSASAFALSKEQCIAAADQGQDLRADGKLTAARKQFEACAATGCPKSVATSCAQWIGELDQALPTVVLRARRSDGTDVTPVTVTENGVVVGVSGGGKAIALDPGPHTFRFDAEGKSVVVTVVVAEGEKLRVVTAAFPSAPSASTTAYPPPTPVDPPSPPRGHAATNVAIVASAVAVIGVGGFAYFGLTGSARGERCTPRCSPDEVSSVRRSYLFADVSLAVGAAAAGTALIALLLSSGGSRSPRASDDKPPASLGLSPIRGGWVAAVSMAF